MNRHFRNETHRRNERMQMEMNVKMNVEMNQPEEDNMNQEFTDKELINKVQQIEDKELKTTVLKILNGEDTIKDSKIMEVNIESIKKEIQTNTQKYIIGLKFVTTETPDQVLNSIKIDLRINPLSRFVMYSKKRYIKLQLDNSNMQNICYYFLNSETFYEVMRKLITLNVPIQEIE